MNFSRLALVIAGSLFAALVLLIVVIFTADFGVFKNQIARYASDYLGRPIAFDGELSIRIGSEVQVTASGIRLASTDWTAESDLVSVDHAAVSVSTASLLSDVIVVEELTLRGINAHLVEDEDGRDNYSLPVFEEEEEDAVVRVFLTHGSISDFNLYYNAPAFELPLAFRAAAVDLRERDDSDLVVELTGSLNEAPVTVNGSVGTLDDLMEAENVHFRLSAGIGEITFEASGLLDDLTEPRYPSLELKLDGPGARYVTDILGLEPVTTGPLHFESHVEPGDQGIEIAVDGVFGEFNITLDSRLVDLQSVDTFNVMIEAEGPSLATLGRFAGRSDFPALPFTVDMVADRTGSVFTVDTFLVRAGEASIEADASAPRFPDIEGATAHVLLRGPRFGHFNRLLGLPGNLTGPFEIDARLIQSEGRGDLEVQLMAEAIRAELSADIDERQGFAGTGATLVIAGDDLSILAAALGIGDVPNLGFGGRVDVDIVEEGVRIRSGTAMLAADEIAFDGMVGRDPFSPVTRLKFSSTLADPASTLEPFDIDTAFLPPGELDLAGEIGWANETFLIEDWVIGIADAELRVNGQIGETFELPDMDFDVALSGTSLAALVPPDLGPVPEGPFEFNARVGFDQDAIHLSDVEAQLAGTSAKLSVSTPLSTPFETGAVSLEVEGVSIARLLPMAADYLPAEQAFVLRGASEWGPDAVSIEEMVFDGGDTTIQVDGNVALPPETGRSQLSVNAKLRSLRSLQFLTDQPLPDEPLSLNGIFKGNPERLDVSLLEFELGRSSLTGTAVIQPESEQQPVPKIELTVRSPLVDLTPFGDLLPAGDDAAEPLIESDPDRVIPEFPIPADLIPPLQANVDIVIDQLVAPGYDPNRAALLARVDQGAVHVEHFELIGDLLNLTGKLDAVPLDDGMALEFRIDGTQMTLGMPVKSEEERDLLPRYDATVKLASQGATLREHASSATGYVKVVSGEGKLDVAVVRFLMSDFTAQVFNTVNPFAKTEKYSNVQCVGVLIELADGVMFGDPAMVFQTDKLNIAGVGKIDLTTEKLNATFNTRARKGLGISMSDIVSPYTEVGGTLAHPRLQLNSTSAIFRGSATIATGGISFLARKAGERLLGGKNSCRKAISKAEADILERNL
jgi:hypothetical protein